MAENIIILEKATKIFKAEVVFENISVAFEKGKVYGIIGRNGSGKSVFFKCICGLMPLTAGLVRVNGKIVGKDMEIPSDIGIIIERPGFMQHYSGFKNLKMLAKIHGKATDSTICATMRKVGLDPDNKKWVEKYSLGMLQRLGIAQAILESPELLILDEPMNGLDESGVAEIREIFQSLKAQGVTILMTSHNADDISSLCDETYIMQNHALTKLTYFSLFFSSQNGSLIRFYYERG